MKRSYSDRVAYPDYSTYKLLNEYDRFLWELSVTHLFDAARTTPDTGHTVRRHIFNDATAATSNSEDKTRTYTFSDKVT